MRWLLIFVTGLFVIWSGYWAIGSRAALNGVRNWVASAPGEGIDLQTGDITLAGYPNRFDLTVTAPRYADAATGWRWTAPFVQVLALSYQPWKVIVALPDEQTLSRPGETIGVTSGQLRASLAVFPTGDLGLDTIIVEGDAVAVMSDLGWSGRAEHAVLALRKIEGQPASYEFGLQVDALAPDAVFATALTTGSDLPGVMDSATADVIAVLSAPLDRTAGATRPEVKSLDVKTLRVIWGPLTLHAEGTLAPDDEGLAEGRIDLRVTNWRHLVPLMVASGAVKPELSETAGNMLAALAQQSPDPEVLALPLTLADGWMSLGPFPLGPAPAMRTQPGF